MYRAVLDTNILVSALLKPKNKPAEIVRSMALREILVFYNQAIFKEYKSVLPRLKFDFEVDDINYLLELFRLLGVLLEPGASVVPLPDESDRIFYDTARAADAYLIAGNLKHYPPKPFIVSPAAFLQVTA